ncbi:MAG: BspA family leucine-rich repeat surface protein, partial [Lachnospiraceae bacterium]|nr:BspA family leucine-rich repeat surface protein [Lachnospiraceae bacterium]
MRKRMLAILLSFALTMAGISPVNYQVHARELTEVSEVSMEESLSVNESETGSTMEESLSDNETETESSTEEDLLDDINITQGESAGNGESIMEEMPEQLTRVPGEMTEEPIQTTEESKEVSVVSETLSESNGEFVYGGTITEKGANITWGIDTNGKLVVSGTGEISSRPWQYYPYNREVKSAEISVSGSGTMSRLLAYCEKLERVDFSGSNMETVTDISDMFLNCTALKTVEFGEWNIGNVTDMSGMFYGCSSLESLDLREWKTELVTDTSLMFCGCAALTTLNLEGWNVKNVKNAEWMFLDCSALTQLKIGDWKPENLTNMDSMFQRCSSLSELDLKAWNVEKVTNMRYLFAQCKKLVKVNLSGWNTESATNMEYMFSGCELLEEVPLTILAVGEDADLRYMYENCVSFKAVDISNWNIENASILMGMFTGCKSLNHITMQGWKAEGKLFAIMFSGCSGLQTADMSNWKATGADLGSMFSGCSNLHTVKLSGFNAENADMSFMFSSCQRLQNIDIEGWNIKGVTSMSDMFRGCGALTEMDMSSWDFTGVGKLDSMFRGCSSLEKVNLKDSDLSSVTTMAGMFYHCTNLTEVDLRNVDTTNVTSMAGMFSYCWALENLDLSDLDTSNVQNMSDMFDSCKALKKLDLSSFDTRQVTTMSGMFESCSGLEELNLTGWDTRSLTDMSRMFSDCEIWRFLELGNLNTQNVTDMSELFFNCNTITEITLEDLNGLNTSNVQTMEGMFAQSEKLKKVNLKNLDISNVSDISGMFDGCRALEEVELSNWDTQNVQEMSTMFRQCTSLREVDFSSWNTENLRTSAAMFEDCTALTSVDVSTWKTHNLSSIASMFEGCKSLTELDLGNFDLRNGTNSTSLVEDCEALTLIIAPRNNDTWVLLPVNYKDQWYLSDGSSITTLPMGQNYNPAIRRNSIPDPSEDRRQLEDIIVNGIEINGSGIAHVTFPLLNNNGNIQKNKNVWYRFEVSEVASVSENQETLEVALSEEDGYVTVNSPVLTNTTGENEEVTLTAHLWMEDEKKGREELLYTVTFHATVKPLAFAQSWELGVEGSVTGKISEGVGAKVGVGSVEASLAEAEITGTVGGNLSVEHELDGDTRNLTLFQTYNAKIAGNASAGLAGEAKLLGKELEIDIASAEGGVAAGASVGIGLQLEDYDPQNLRQLTEIGKFMLASQAQATGNAMLLRLAELTGVNFYNLTQVGHAISVEAGANLGSLELDDVTEGSLLAASKERVFSYDITKNREDGSKEFAFTRNGVDEIGILNLSQDVGIGSIDHSVFSTSADTSLEVSTEVDGNGTVQGFSVKKEVADSEGSINTTGTVEAVEVSYEQEAVEQLARESNVVNKFINGTSYYVMGEAQKELFEDLDESASEGLYTVSMTNQKMTEVEFEVGLTAVLGLEAGVAFEGAHSYEYETAGGTYQAGAKHITHTNEIEDLVKAKDEEYNIVKLVVEPFTTVVKSVTDFLADASEDIKEGVRNALAELKQSGQLSEENLPDWILHLVTVKTDEKSEEMVSQSYEIMAYSPVEEITLMSNEEAEVEEQKVYTIGDPYCVYVTDVDGNEVADYSENPLELTLKYTDEMLTGAGVSGKDLEKLAIYQYSEELLGYVCRGGALDQENQCVTLEITKPGQYLLAIDAKAPAVTTINVEADGKRPIIRVNFDEDCGFKEFSLKIDDTEYLGTADWNAYYNAPLRQITYQPETELSEGNHTLTVYAVDGAGNAMEEPAAYQFCVDTQAPVLKAMELTCEGNILVIKAWTDDTDLLKMTATVSQNQMTEVIKTSTLQMISDNGCYHAELVLEEGGDSVSVSVMAEDKSGNKSQPLVETKKVESQREGLRYVFVDGSGLEHSEYTYTGSAIIPEVLIYDGNTLLTLKKDYTLAYSKNVNV